MTQEKLDAEYLASILTAKGMTRDDLAVCFEMSWVSAVRHLVDGSLQRCLAPPHLEGPGRQARQPVLRSTEARVRSALWRRPLWPSLEHALLLGQLPPNRSGDGPPPGLY